MGTLDIILLLFFIPAVVRGISKGFIEQLVGIASIIIGAWLAFKFTEPVSAWLGGYLSWDSSVLNIVAFVLIALVISLVLKLIGNLISSLLKDLSLGFVNRILGLVFSLLKTALVIGLIIYLFDGLNSKITLVNPETLSASVIYTNLKDAADVVFPFLKDLISNKANA